MSDKVDISVYDEYSYYSAIADQIVKAIVAQIPDPKPAGPVGVEPLVGAREAGPTRDADTGSQPRPIGAREIQYDKSCGACRRCETVAEHFDAFLITELVMKYS